MTHRYLYLAGALAFVLCVLHPCLGSLTPDSTVGLLAGPYGFIGTAAFWAASMIGNQQKRIDQLEGQLRDADTQRVDS